MASLIISFTDTDGSLQALWRSLILLGGLSVVLVIARNSWVDRKLSGRRAHEQAVEEHAAKYAAATTRDAETMMDSEEMRGR